MNSVLTAKQLYIHRNTLHNRLKAISEIITLDMENPERRLFFMVSFEIIELSKKIGEY